MSENFRQFQPAVLELSEPVEYSPEDVADAVGRHLALGRHVRAQHLSMDAVLPTLMSMRFSENVVARLFKEMYAGMERGRMRFEGNGAAHARGLVTPSEAVSDFLSPARGRPLCRPHAEQRV